MWLGLGLSHVFSWMRSLSASGFPWFLQSCSCLRLSSCLQECWVDRCSLVVAWDMKGQPVPRLGTDPRGSCSPSPHCLLLVAYGAAQGHFPGTLEPK